MKELLRFLIVFQFCYSCGGKTDLITVNPTSTSDSLRNNTIPTLELPFVIGDSILQKSTYATMKGFDTIAKNIVDSHLYFESLIDSTKSLTEQCKFYVVGQIKTKGDYITVIYLKSFKPEFVNGGRRDIYRLATYDKNGGPISQLDIASFDESTKEGGDYYWNTCKIDTNLEIAVQVRKEYADYARDTSLFLYELQMTYNINKYGRILPLNM